MADSFVDALIKRMQEKGEDVSRVLSPNSSTLDRLGSAADLAFTPVEALQKGYESVIGANRALVDYNRAQGGLQGAIAEQLPRNPLEILLAATGQRGNLQALTSGRADNAPANIQDVLQKVANPNQALEYNDAHRTPAEAITENLLSPAFLLGKGHAINELGKSEAVGNLAKTLLGDQAVLNNPVARGLSKAELISQLPVTAPVEGAAKAIGGIGKVTGLSRLTQRGQATKNLDTASTEVSSLRQTIDAAYSDVPADQRPTPADFKTWQTSGDPADAAKLEDFAQRLERLVTGESAPAAAAQAAPQAPRSGPIVGQDPLARPALPGEAPVAARPASEGILAERAQQQLDQAQQSAAASSDVVNAINGRQFTPQPNPNAIPLGPKGGPIPPSPEQAQAVRMQEIIAQFDDWAQRFENPELKGMADRLRAGGLSPEEKQQIAVVFNVMRAGENRAPAAAEAIAPKVEEAVPQAAPEVASQAETAAQPVAANGTANGVDRYNQLFPEDAIAPGEANQIGQFPVEPRPVLPKNGTPRPDRPLPPPVSEVGIEEATGTVSPQTLAANKAAKEERLLAREEAAQHLAEQFQSQGVSKPSKAAVARAVGMNPRSLEAGQLHSAVLKKLTAVSENVNPRVGETAAEIAPEAAPAPEALQQTLSGNQASAEAALASPGAERARALLKRGKTPAEATKAFADSPMSEREKLAAVNQIAAEQAPAADQRLDKLMKAAKREGITDIISEEMNFGNNNLQKIAQQIKSIFPQAKTDEELMAVVQRVAQERGGTASLGAAAGFGQDENGNVQFDPQRAGLGAAIGAVAPGNTRVVLKGPVPEQLIAALGKRFGAANVARGAENVLDLKVAGRISEKALRDFVQKTAQQLGVDTTDALIAHPQGSDIGVLVKGADAKLQAMIQRILPKGASLTPTEDGLQVLLRQTPSGSRGAGTAGQQAAASRSLYGKLAEAVKAHGLNPDEVLQAGRPRIEPLGAPTQAAATASPAAAQPATPSALDRINTALRGLGTDTTELDSLLGKQQAVSQSLEGDQKAAQDILARIQAKVPQPIQTAQQAFDNSYAQRVAGDDLKALRKLQDKYGFDVLDQAQWAEHLPKLTEERLITSYQEGTAPTALDKVTGSAAARYGTPAAALGAIGAVSAPDEDKTKAAGLGVGAGLLSASPIGRALSNSFKQILLLSPRYHVNNLSDIGVKSVLNGIKPFLSESTAAAYLRDWGQLTPEAEKQLVNLDGGLLQSFKTASREFHKGVDINRSVVEGFSKEIGDAPALIRLLKLSKPAQANRMIAQTFERDARVAAYIQGKEQYLQSQVVGFADRLAQVSPEAAAAVRNSGGRISQAKLAELLDTAGVKGAPRGNALGEWARLLRSGDQHGADLANTIHFNYRYTTSFDEFMGQLMLFHIYSTRNLVYYPKLLAEHPMVAASIVKLEQQSADDVDKRGLTSRFLGNIPGGEGASRVASALFGQNGEAFVNPAQYISIVQQLLPLAKQSRNVSDESAVGSAVEGARNIGLGINPIGEIALGAGGALGDSVPSSGVLTPLQPITAALRGLQGAGAIGPVGGSTIETDPTVGLTSGLIKGLGTNVTDFSQLAIKKRIAEMAIEQGKAPGAYDAAALDPSSPIYKEAVRQVAAQQSVKGGLSYAGGPNIQFLPDSEAQIRAARQGQPTFNPNASPLERALYGQERGKATQAETTRATTSADTFNRMLQTDPQGMARAAQKLGADVSVAPDGSVKLTVGGDILRPIEMAEVLKQYQYDGGKIGLMSQAYSGINREPADLAQNKAKDKAQVDQILATYQAATPAQKAAMLADPNVRFVLSQQRRTYTPNGAYR